MGNVTALHTGGKPNAACVAKLRELLERAEAGEVVGLVCVTMQSDLTASQAMAGLIGGSMMIGQFRIAEHDLMAITVAGRGE